MIKGEYAPTRIIYFVLNSRKHIQEQGRSRIRGNVWKTTQQNYITKLLNVPAPHVIKLPVDRAVTLVGAASIFSGSWVGATSAAFIPVTPTKSRIIRIFRSTGLIIYSLEDPSANLGIHVLELQIQVLVANGGGAVRSQWNCIACTAGNYA